MFVQKVLLGRWYIAPGSINQKAFVNVFSYLIFTEVAVGLKKNASGTTDNRWRYYQINLK